MKHYLWLCKRLPEGKRRSCRSYKNCDVSILFMGFHGRTHGWFHVIQIDHMWDFGTYETRVISRGSLIRDQLLLNHGGPVTWGWFDGYNSCQKNSSWASPTMPCPTTRRWFLHLNSNWNCSPEVYQSEWNKPTEGRSSFCEHQTDGCSYSDLVFHNNYITYTNIENGPVEIVAFPK